ncbi:MAG: hypothetical protein RJA78_891 [Actinomycetota bacterium]
MDFVGAIQSGFKNYVTFGGVAKRAEYWYWVLFTFLVGLVAGAFDVLLGIGLLGNLIALATFLPSLAVSVRRLRDAGKSWVWLLSPLPGAIIAVVGLVLMISNLFIQGYVSSVEALNDENFPSDELLEQIVTDSSFLPGLGVFLLGFFLASVFNLLVNVIFMILPSKSYAQGNKKLAPTI